MSRRKTRKEQWVTGMADAVARVEKLAHDTASAHDTLLQDMAATMIKCGYWPSGTKMTAKEQKYMQSQMNRKATTYPLALTAYEGLYRALDGVRYVATKGTKLYDT